MKKETARLYSVEVAQSSINILNEVITSGKNAQVLITLANNIQANKKLPKWALTAFNVEHFEKVLTLKADALRKACKSDSYDFIRTIVNNDIKGNILGENDALKLAELLKIQTFSKNECLNAILDKYKKAMADNAEPTSNAVADTDAAKKIKSTKSVEIETQNSQVFTMADQIASLSLDDALKLREALDAHIAKLQAEAMEKAA